MQNIRQRRETPPYPIASVDHALILVQLLRDAGPIRIADAAAELEVAPSTAHRLLAMLVYREFAIQDEDRWYHPGPAIGQPPISEEWTRELRMLARPHLERLTDEVGESSNLMIRVGARVRFLLTVQSLEGGAVGDRQGTILPAIYTAGGRAMLAHLSSRSLETLLASAQASRSGDALAQGERVRLRRELASVKRLGYAKNVEDTELGLSAVGVAIRDADGHVAAGIAVAMRSSRAARLQSSTVIQRLRVSAENIEASLVAAELRASNKGA